MILYEQGWTIKLVNFPLGTYMWLLYLDVVTSTAIVTDCFKNNEIVEYIPKLNDFFHEMYQKSLMDCCNIKCGYTHTHTLLHTHTNTHDLTQ